MASEPTARLTGADFLNQIRTTLDASLQRWSFAGFPEYAIDAYVASVQFANGHGATILYRRGWQVASDDGLADWLTARLNGHTRDDSGNLREVPPPTVRDEAGYVPIPAGARFQPGDQFLTNDGNWVGIDSAYEDHHDGKSPERFRRPKPETA